MTNFLSDPSTTSLLFSWFYFVYLFILFSTITLSVKFVMWMIKRDNWKQQKINLWKNSTFLVPPHLKGDGMHDITLKKGRPIRYDLWFGGEPAPSVEWIRDGRTLMSDQFTSIELYCKNTIYTERNTVLSIPKVKIGFLSLGIKDTWC